MPLLHLISHDTRTHCLLPFLFLFLYRETVLLCLCLWDLRMSQRLVDVPALFTTYKC